jgi:cobalamin biosynthesis Mg chelatase CobN
VTIPVESYPILPHQSPHFSDLGSMSRNDLNASDIPFLLEQLDQQNKQLAAAEATIAKLERDNYNAKLIAEKTDERDEMDLELETLQDRYNIKISIIIKTSSSSPPTLILILTLL